MEAQEINTVINACKVRLPKPDVEIVHILTDSRRLFEPQGTLFFAIPTERNTGCRYIDDLYRRGVRSFVVPADCQADYPDANIWQVDNVVLALQHIAAYRRRQYTKPLIAITGSNGAASRPYTKLLCASHRLLHPLFFSVLLVLIEKKRRRVVDSG